MPAVCLVVSGGHTVIYEVTAASAGAAHVAKQRFATGASAIPEMMLLVKHTTKWPGCWRLVIPAGRSSIAWPPAPQAQPQDTDGGEAPRFAAVKIKGNPYDFSFSGIKTAVLYYVRAHPELEPEIDARRAALDRGERKAAQLLRSASPQTLGLLASFQRTVVGELAGRTFAASPNGCAQRFNLWRRSRQRRIARGG